MPVDLEQALERPRPVEAGQRRSKVETVELAPLVGEAVALLAPRVEREGARLAADVPPGAAFELTLPLAP